MVKILKTLILLGLLFFAYKISENYYLNPINVSEKSSIKIVILENTSALKIGEILVKAGLIRNQYIFKYYLRYHNADLKLHAGSYDFSPSMSLPEISLALQKGEKERLIFTIPEGYTVKQIARLLDDKKFVNYDRFLDLSMHKKFQFQFLSYNPNQKLNNPLEGYLFPDTYYIPRDFGEEKIIGMMLNRFDEVFDITMRNQAKKLSLSIPEVVTMASLVEREAKATNERSLIAGVFTNRINKKMRLESCASVQYLFDKPRPVLLYEDLKIVSPYNTYRNYGLPPGPIANPGKASLMAALFPKKTDYLFFVAKNDGTHFFSKTLAEHNKAKSKTR